MTIKEIHNIVKEDFCPALTSPPKYKRVKNTGFMAWANDLAQVSKDYADKFDISDFHDVELQFEYTDEEELLLLLLT